MGEKLGSADHTGHRKRIKNRYNEYGIRSLDDRALIELILTYAIPRRDVYMLADSLIGEFGSAEEVLYADRKELMSRGKLSEHTVTLIKLFSDVRRLEFRHETPEPVKLTSVLKAVEYCHSLLAGSKEELIIELFINEEAEVVDQLTVSYGSEEAALMPIEQMTAYAKRRGVRRIVAAHNHPSGKSTPSKADLNATERLSNALAEKGMLLAEHIIIAKNEGTAILHHQTISMKKPAEEHPWSDEQKGGK